MLKTLKINNSLKSYFILSSALNQFSDFGLRTVNISEEINRIADNIINISRDSQVPLDMTSYNPPIQITDKRIGITYLTRINHHLPSFNEWLLLFKKPINLSALNTYAKTTHSTMTENMGTILFTNASVIPSMYPPAEVAKSLKLMPLQCIEWR